MVAAADGRLTEAEALFADAMEMFRRFGLPFEEADTAHLWGNALANTDRTRALEKHDAALETYTRRDVGKAWIDWVLADRARAD